MRRLLLIPSTAAVLGLLAVGCGTSGGDAFDTLPPIRTTTSTSTTTTTPDERRKFYEVKAGDNIAEIARRFQVPRSEIVKLNDLPNDGGIIQIGQILEIPTDVLLVETLPPLPATSEP